MHTCVRSQRCPCKDSTLTVLVVSLVDFKPSHMPWGLLSIICLHCLTGFAYAVDDNSVHALSSLQWNVAVGNSVGNACSPAPSSASETKWIPIDEYFSKKIGQEVSGAASIRVEMSSIPTAQQLLVLPAAALTAYANDREIPIVPSEGMLFLVTSAVRRCHLCCLLQMDLQSTCLNSSPTQVFGCASFWIIFPHQLRRWHSSDASKRQRRRVQQQARVRARHSAPPPV